MSDLRRTTLAAVLLATLTACATHSARDVAPESAALEEEQSLRSDGAVVTTRETTLRVRPAPGAWTLARLPAGTRLKWVGGETAHAFSLVVQLDKGPSGWVRSSDLEVVQAPVLAGFESEAACATDLSTCPTRGCAVNNTPGAILNTLKQHVPTGDPVVTLSFDDFAFLQQQADVLVGQLKDLDADERATLMDLDVIEGKVSEGDKVKLIAYLTQESSGPHANSSGESVNCKLKGSDSNDFHIPVSEDAAYSEFDAIVIEMIPQRRPASWTTAELRKVQREGWPVWIEGGLFYDNIHVVNSDPDNVLHGQPKRFSLWEIHPVTKFLVCRQEECDTTDESAWSPL